MKYQNVTNNCGTYTLAQVGKSVLLIEGSVQEAQQDLSVAWREGSGSYRQSVPPLLSSLLVLEAMRELKICSSSLGTVDSQG